MTERERLITLATALQEKEARKAFCPIAAYQPHPGQHQLHYSTSPTTLVCTGNRWGKTEGLVADCIAAVLGYRPWELDEVPIDVDSDGYHFWSAHDPRVPSSALVRRCDGLPVRHPGKFLVVTGLPLARGIGEIIQEKFAALWPKDIPFKTHLGSLGVWQKAVFPNGAEVYFGSAQQANLAFEGFNADGAFFDEPCPKRVYTAVKRGLIDRNAWLKWTMTPLGGSELAWVAADLFHDNENVTLLRGTSYDNPFLNREALDRYLDDPTLSEAERRARKTGELAAIGQRIVTTFDDKCTLPPTTIPHDVPRVLVADPHHSKPTCMIWAAVYGDGDDREWVIYREWPEVDVTKAGVPRLTIPDLAGEIKSLEGREDVQWRFADPKFGVQHAKVLGMQFRSFVEQMGDYRLQFDVCVDNDVDRGIQKLRDAFRISPETGKPRVLVMKNCQNTIRALNYWAYDGISDEGKLKPSEVYKDFADVVRYMVMAEYPLTSEEAWSYLDEE